MHINTPETKAKVWANSLVAKAHSIAYLFPFYPCTGCGYDKKERGARTETTLSGYINH